MENIKEIKKKQYEGKIEGDSAIKDIILRKRLDEGKKNIKMDLIKNLNIKYFDDKEVKILKSLNHE